MFITVFAWDWKVAAALQYFLTTQRSEEFPGLYE